MALPELAEVPEGGTRTLLSLPAPRFDEILEAASVLDPATG